MFCKPIVAKICWWCKLSFDLLCLIISTKPADERRRGLWKRKPALWCWTGEWAFAFPPLKGGRGDVALISEEEKMLPYSRTRKPLARELRKTQTGAEELLWYHIRRKQILGVQFNRQRPIAGYIVDFYSLSALWWLSWMVRSILSLTQSRMIWNARKCWNRWVWKWFDLITRRFFGIEWGRFGDFESSWNASLKQHPPCPPSKGGKQKASWVLTCVVWCEKRKPALRCWTEEWAFLLW